MIIICTCLFGRVYFTFSSFQWITDEFKIFLQYFVVFYILQSRETVLVEGENPNERS